MKSSKQHSQESLFYKEYSIPPPIQNYYEDLTPLFELSEPESSSQQEHMVEKELEETKEGNAIYEREGAYIEQMKDEGEEEKEQEEVFVQDFPLETEKQEKRNKRGKRKERKTKKVQKRKGKNKTESKNIPKNYGKEIIKFVHKNQNGVIDRLIHKTNTTFSYDQIDQYLQTKKNRMSKIMDLRDLWVRENEFGRVMRVICQHFIRTRSLNWIFNSRIEEVKAPIKYRLKLREGIKNPDEFLYLKIY